MHCVCYIYIPAILKADFNLYRWCVQMIPSTYSLSFELPSCVPIYTNVKGVFIPASWALVPWHC